MGARVSFPQTTPAQPFADSNGIGLAHIPNGIKSACWRSAQIGALLNCPDGKVYCCPLAILLRFPCRFPIPQRFPKRRGTLEPLPDKAFSGFYPLDSPIPQRWGSHTFAGHLACLADVCIKKVCEVENWGITPYKIPETLM